MADVFVERLSVERELVSDDERGQWPFTIPCVAAIARDGLELRRPVTFLVGENGSGKSTLVEAIAEAAGLDARGGRAGRKYGNQRPMTRLGEVMRLGLTREGAKMRLRARNKRKGYFLRAETLFGLAEVVSGLPGYWPEEFDPGGGHHRGRRLRPPPGGVGRPRHHRPLAPLPHRPVRLPTPPDRPLSC